MEIARGQAIRPSIRPERVNALIGGAICAALLIIFIRCVQPYSFGYTRMSGIVFFGEIFFAPICLLLWAIFAFQSWQKPSYILIRRLIELHALAAFGLAILCILEFFRIPIGPLSHYSFIGLMVLPIIGLAAFPVDALVLIFAPRATAGADNINRYRRGQLMLAGGAVVAIGIWSFVNIGLMVLQAQIVADGKPYCIQIARDGLGRYRTITSLIDMNGLKMNTPISNAGGSTDYQFAFHAVLKIGDTPDAEWRNWSYWQQHFVSFDPKYFDLRSSCQSRKNFALELPLF